MRRSEKAITDKDMMQTVLNEAILCRIGLCKDNFPYVVPMNFAYRDDALYMHAAMEGKKIDIINDNPHVCFEMEHKAEVVPSRTSCGWSMRYYSIIGWGNASFITDAKGKTEALSIIMEKYAGKTNLSFTDAILDKVAIIRIQISEMTGKFSGYQR